MKLDRHCWLQYTILPNIQCIQILNLSTKTHNLVLKNCYEYFKNKNEYLGIYRPKLHRNGLNYVPTAIYYTRYKLERCLNWYSEIIEIYENMMLKGITEHV